MISAVAMLLQWSPVDWKWHYLMQKILYIFLFVRIIPSKTIAEMALRKIHELHSHGNGNCNGKTSAEKKQTPNGGSELNYKLSTWWKWSVGDETQFLRARANFIIECEDESLLASSCFRLHFWILKYWSLFCNSSLNAFIFAAFRLAKHLLQPALISLHEKRC